MKIRRRTVLLALVFAILLLVLGVHGWGYGYYRAGQQALGHKDYDRARAHLDRSLKVWFWNPQPHLLAARAARSTGAFDEAEKHLRACAALGGPEDAVRLERQLLVAQQGDLDRVHDDLVERVRQNHPDSVLILEVLTPAYLSRYRLADAAALVQRWLELEPDNLEALQLGAQIYRYLPGHEHELAACLGRVVELDPDNLPPRLTYGGLLIETGRPEEALAQFEYLRARAGDSPQVLAGLARCLRALHRPEESRQLLDQLLALQPRNAQALAERGRVAVDLQAPAEAAQWFERAAAVTPYEKEVLQAWQRCLERLGKRQEAVAVGQRLQRVDADLARLAELTAAVARSPHDARLRSEIGTTLLRCGQDREALRWLASALREAPDCLEAHRALADYFERSGYPDRAAEHRRLVVLSGGALTGKSQ
jgi:tetratricopeptide (TPR) repeat protein